MYKGYPDIINKLAFMTEVQEFGSRALGVAYKKSDYDFVFLLTDEIFDELSSMPECNIVDLSEYMPIIPTEKFTYFKISAPGVQIDLIGLSITSDLNSVTKTIDDMLKMGREFLANKRKRVLLYRTLLLYNGWKLSENYHINVLDY